MLDMGPSQALPWASLLWLVLLCFLPLSSAVTGSITAPRSGSPPRELPKLMVVWGTPELAVGTSNEHLGNRAPRLCSLANSSGRPLANSPRCVKRGLWLTICTLVRLGVSVRNVTYSGGSRGGGWSQATYITVKGADFRGTKERASTPRAHMRWCGSGSESPGTGGNQGQAGGPHVGAQPWLGAGTGPKALSTA